MLPVPDKAPAAPSAPDAEYSLSFTRYEWQVIVDGLIHTLKQQVPPRIRNTAFECARRISVKVGKIPDDMPQENLQPQTTEEI